MPHNVSGLNLYDEDKFKAFGQQIVNDSKKIVDKAITPVADVPVVDEQGEENMGLDVVTISQDAKISNTNILQNNAVDNVYDDM